MILKSIAATLEGRALLTITPQDTVRAACGALCEHGIGALAVVEGERLVGILSERDVIRRCLCADRDPRETRVSEIMTADPLTITEDRSLGDALTLMKRGGFRHIPVVRDGAAVGMVSIRDIPLDYRLMRERFDEARTPMAEAV